MDLPERVEIIMEGDVAYVRVGGDITEDSDLSAISKMRAKRVVLDLEAFIRMTSRGVALWTEMIDELCKHVGTVAIENAPHGFLLQYAMISGIAGRAQIESILATYACDRCGVQKTVLLSRSTDFPDGRLRPRKMPTCDRCKLAMVGDDLLFELDVRL